MAFNITYVLVGVLQLVACVWKARDLARDPNSPRLRAMTTGLAFVAIGFDCASPAVYTAIGDLTGIPNAATLVVYVSITVCTGVLQLLVVNINRDENDVLPASRVLTLGTAAAITAMVLLFIAAPVHDVAHPIDFDAHYGSREPLVVAFLAVYLSAYSLGLSRCGLICRRIGPHAQGSLRVGLRFVLVGVAFGLGYSVLKAASITAAWLGYDWDVVNIWVAPASAVIGACLMATGFLLPSVPRLRQDRQIRRDLAPMWRALRVLAPDTSAWAPLASARDRWLVGVGDQLRRLRDYLDPEVQELAQELADRDPRGLSGERRDAAVEAARIAAALRAHRAGRRVGDGLSMIREESGLAVYSGQPGGVAVWQEPDHRPGRAIVDEELRQLCLIGRAFAEPDPLVTAVLRALDQRSDREPH